MNRLGSGAAEVGRAATGHQGGQAGGNSRGGRGDEECDGTIVDWARAATRRRGRAGARGGRRAKGLQGWLRGSGGREARRGVTGQ